VGTLLVVTTVQPSGPTTGGLATFEISDPERPEFLHFLQTQNGHYTSFFNGGRIFGLGLQYQLDVFGVAESGRIAFLGQHGDGGGRGGYGQYQDGYVHAGMSEAYVKFDVRGVEPRRMGSYALLGDNDWVLVLGNMVFLGDDDEGRAALLPHQEDPDSLGPQVNGIWPRDGAMSQPMTTRVGISFTDNIDLASVIPQNLTLSKIGGSALPGAFSVQSGLVNFSPEKPLDPGAVYEIHIPAGGIKDWAGNPIKTDFRARFSTGTAVFISKNGHRLSKFAKYPFLGFRKFRAINGRCQYETAQSAPWIYPGFNAP
jgi:hypothetical protein